MLIGSCRKAALLALTLCVACGGDSPTAPAPVASIRVTPGTTGMAKMTEFIFDGSGSSGQTLTYAWNFGDGQTGSGVVGRHTYTNAGTYTATLTATGSGTSNASVTVTVTRDLNGRWDGKVDDNDHSPLKADNIIAVQTGTTLSGLYEGVSGFSFEVVDNGTISGSVNSSTFACPCSVTFTVTVPRMNPFTFTGQVNATVDTMTGTVVGSGYTGQSWTMIRK